jgi:hypothetical protein
MSLINRIVVEIHCFQKRYGHKPKYLILNNCTDTFYNEIFDYIMNNSEMTFENPIAGHRKFMGLTLVNNRVTIEGNFSFSLGE